METQTRKTMDDDKQNKFNDLREYHEQVQWKTSTK